MSTYGVRREYATMRECDVPLERVIKMLNNGELIAKRLSWTPGYLGRKSEPIVSEYNGRYGAGYVIEMSPEYKIADYSFEIPKHTSTRMHLIIYCVCPEDSFYVEYLKKHCVYKKGMSNL